VVALNCNPCSLSLTHWPAAASHSPAVTDGNDPTTVVSSRCPFVLTRRTQKPFSSLWKVTRSMTPEIPRSRAGAQGSRHSFVGIHFPMDAVLHCVIGQEVDSGGYSAAGRGLRVGSASCLRSLSSSYTRARQTDGSSIW
jgi:hypothetical protein